MEATIRDIEAYARSIPLRYFGVKARQECFDLLLTLNRELNTGIIDGSVNPLDVPHLNRRMTQCEDAIETRYRMHTVTGMEQPARRRYEKPQALSIEELRERHKLNPPIR